MISKGLSTVSFEQFRESTPDTWVAHNYFGIDEFPVLMNSPIRKDKHPSFSIYLSNDGVVKFIDFANGSKGDIYTLLGLLWKMPRKEAIERVRKECKGFSSSSFTLKRTNAYHAKTKQSTLNVVTREWQQYDLDYWESYGINKAWLEFGNVFPISRILIIKNGETTGVPCEKYAYVYVENKDGKQTLKVYQPFSKQFKWMSKHDSSVWDLWEQLPESGDNLIITSSRKDALCIWSNTGIPAVSLQGEGYIPKENVVSQLKSRFKNVYVLYDNDFQSDENHGRIYGETIAKMFDLKQIEIPSEWEAKDTSDLCKKWGRSTVYTVIKSLIQ